MSFTQLVQDNLKVIGTVVIGSALLLAYKVLFGRKKTATEAKAAPTEEAVLSPTEYRKFKLIEKKELTSGVLCPVKLYRFEIPGGKSLGLPVGQHVWIRATIEGKEERRSYTPTSSNDDKGYFDLVIKIYPKGVMSQYVDSLKIGDYLDVCGPKGEFAYKKNQFKHIGMLAGGTGITPMLQVMTEICKHADDTTQVSLLFGNLTLQDIILKDTIDELAKKNKNIKVYYVLNETPAGWTQGQGFITAELIGKFFPQASEDTKVLLCGPPPMIKAMREHLTTLGYERKHTHSF